MKMLLTSNGLSSSKLRRQFRKLLTKDVARSKIIVLYTIQRPEYISFVDRTGRKLQRAGILLPHVTYFNIANRAPQDLLSGYDAVYVCGGNTFFILHCIRKSGLDKQLGRFAKGKGVYIGASAGSMIAGKNIEMAGWGEEEDSNKINLINLEGLNFTEIVVYPHYKASFKKEVEGFRKKLPYPVVALRDEEALLIIGKRVKKIRAR